MAEIVHFPAAPQTRLRAALRALEAALDEQRDAIADFRQELALLDQSVAGLGLSVEGYRDALATTADELTRAGVAARRLEQTAALAELD